MSSNLPEEFMSRRTENECAYCIEKVEIDKGIIGKDRKVYCSNDCVELGEALSEHEWQRLMSVATKTRAYILPEQLA